MSVSYTHLDVYKRQATLIIGIYFLFERGSSLTGLMLTLWSILMPFFLGGVLAFVLNVPMRFLERREMCIRDRSRSCTRRAPPSFWWSRTRRWR